MRLKRIFAGLFSHQIVIDSALHIFSGYLLPVESDCMVYDNSQRPCAIVLIASLTPFGGRLVDSLDFYQITVFSFDVVHQVRSVQESAPRIPPSGTCRARKPRLRGVYIEEFNQNRALGINVSGENRKGHQKSKSEHPSRIHRHSPFCQKVNGEEYLFIPSLVYIQSLLSKHLFLLFIYMSIGFMNNYPNCRG